MLLSVNVTLQCLCVIAFTVILCLYFLYDSLSSICGSCMLQYVASE